jgi:hypothetical protein
MFKQQPKLQNCPVMYREACGQEKATRALPWGRLTGQSP